MQYKPETITRYKELMNIAIKEYENLPEDSAELKVCVSKGNVKIGKVLNVSLAPILTCGNCKHCKWYCYDIKACYRYGKTLRARARNTVLAQKYRDKYFKQINDEIKRHRVNKYFRWHVAGDILDYNYLENMIRIAVENPDWKFWSYTKMYHLVNRWIKLNGELPKNIKIMFSKWNGVNMPNPWEMPWFGVLMEEDERNGLELKLFGGIFKCRGNCDYCKKEFTGNDKFPSNEGKCRGCIGGEPAYAKEH